MAYDVKADGTIANGRVFFDATAWVQSKPGLPDGMKLDKNGNLFATGPGGLHVFSSDGKHLGAINTGEKTANSIGVTMARCSTSPPIISSAASKPRPKGRDFERRGKDDWGEGLVRVSRGLS